MAFQGQCDGERMERKMRMETRMGRSKQTRNKLMDERIGKLKEHAQEVSERALKVKIAEEERKTALA